MMSLVRIFEALRELEDAAGGQCPILGDAIVRLSELEGLEKRRANLSGISPYGDSSDPTITPNEKKVLRRLAAGEELVTDRTWIEETDAYAVSWYWSTDPDYPREYDVTVMHLLGRALIRPETCAGGRTWMVLTGDSP